MVQPPNTMVVDFYIQTLENCSFISHEDADLSIITAKEPASGKFRASVVRTEGRGRKKTRVVLLSDVGNTMPEAFELLHTKSAEALHNHVTAVGYGPVQKKSKSKKKNKNKSKNKARSKTWDDSDSSSIVTDSASSSSESDADDDEDDDGDASDASDSTTRLSDTSLSDDETVSISALGKKKKKHNRSAAPRKTSNNNKAPTARAPGYRPGSLSDGAHFTDGHMGSATMGRPPTSLVGRPVLPGMVPPPPPGWFGPAAPGRPPVMVPNVRRATMMPPPPPPSNFPPMPPAVVAANPAAPPVVSATTASASGMRAPPPPPVPTGFPKAKKTTTTITSRSSSAAPPSNPSPFSSSTVVAAAAARERDVILQISWTGHDHTARILAHCAPSKRAIGQEAGRYVLAHRDVFGVEKPELGLRWAPLASVVKAAVFSPPVLHGASGGGSQRFDLQAYHCDDLTGLCDAAAGGGIPLFEVNVTGRPRGLMTSPPVYIDLARPSSTVSGDSVVVEDDE